MEKKLAKIYYGPEGYWKGFAAVKKLAAAAKVSEEAAQKWLFKQASRYKEAEPLTSKNSDEVAKAFQTIYKRSPLTEAPDAAG